eukprot:m.46745 g.46745  ORF g.46745 m.46745 type:complete len:78 (+) comp20323_c0_seq1:372-605(+)
MQFHLNTSCREKNICFEFQGKNHTSLSSMPTDESKGSPPALPKNEARHPLHRTQYLAQPQRHPPHGPQTPISSSTPR